LLALKNFTAQTTYYYRLREKEYLSIEEQVDSLIDHATDRNLLGRMYVGWTAAV